MERTPEAVHFVIKTSTGLNIIRIGTSSQSSFSHFTGNIDTNETKVPGSK